MNDKLDVFEILGAEHTKSDNGGQGHESVPDPDFNEAIKQLGARYTEKTPQKTQKTAEVIDNAVSKQPTAEKKTDKSAVEPKKAVRRIRSSLSKRENVPVSNRKSLLKGLMAIAVILLFFTFVINVPKVVGSSMAPCLENGDRVVINLMARNYEAGDIIVFKTDSGEKLVKRIVAVDGDVVNITPENEFYINGREADEEYIYTETAATDIMVAYPVIVNEDTYFVMGDNRVNSKDSRNSDIGLVKKEDIVGKVILCLRKL